MAANRAGIVARVKSCGSQSATSVQVEWRRDACVSRGPHGVGGRYGSVLCVLVVVEEDAMALFLPPLAGRQRRRAAFDLTGQRQGGASHLVERPPPFDADEHVHAP